MRIGHTHARARDIVMIAFRVSRVLRTHVVVIVVVVVACRPVFLEVGNNAPLWALKAFRGSEEGSEKIKGGD